jgi:hypothetical protein
MYVMYVPDGQAQLGVCFEINRFGKLILVSLWLVSGQGVNIGPLNEYEQVEDRRAWHAA